MGEDLGIKVGEETRVKDVFGTLNQQMAGIGGTLHITKESDLAQVPGLAWQLAAQTQKPVIIVVRPAPST